MPFYQDLGKPADGQKVMLATTSYDSPDAAYTFSMHRSRQALAEADINSAYSLLVGNCHVDDARNQMVQEFLLTDCTDLVFLDADVSWQPEDLVRLCRHDCDIVGGVYPYRREDKPDQIPARLKAEAEICDGLLEVEGLPTGFMRIRRTVLEQMAAQASSYETHDGRGRAPLLFLCVTARCDIRELLCMCLLLRLLLLLTRCIGSLSLSSPPAPLWV